MGLPAEDLTDAELIAEARYIPTDRAYVEELANRLAALSAPAGPEPSGVCLRPDYMRTDDGDMKVACGECSACLYHPYRDAVDRAAGVPRVTEAMVADVRTLLDGFDQGVFVRDVRGDSDPAWAIKLMPYLTAMARLKEMCDTALAAALTEGET